MAFGLVLGLVLGLFGCSKDVPDKPANGSSSEPVSVLETMETKQAVFERVGEFTYPIEYTMSGGPGDYKLRDSIYYSMYFVNQVSPSAKTLDEFSEYVSSISKVSLREYNKVHAEEMTLDGHTAWYVEGHGKDSNKYKYAVYMAINTDNGMTVVSAVINEEDWASKGEICKEIMMSFKHKGMIDPEDLKTVLVSRTLKPTLEIPEGWRIVSDETTTKVYKNAHNTVEMTLFFGKQDHASLDKIMQQNGVSWQVNQISKQGFDATEASGIAIPVVTAPTEEEGKGEEKESDKGSSKDTSKSSGKGSSWGTSKSKDKNEEEEEDRTPAMNGVVPGTMTYYALEVTSSGYRFILAMVIKADEITAKEIEEVQTAMNGIRLYEMTDEEKAKWDGENKDIFSIGSLSGSGSIQDSKIEWGEGVDSEDRGESGNSVTTEGESQEESKPESQGESQGESQANLDNSDIKLNDGTESQPESKATGAPVGRPEGNTGS